MIVMRYLEAKYSELGEKSEPLIERECQPNNDLVAVKVLNRSSDKDANGFSRVHQDQGS